MATACSQRGHPSSGSFSTVDTSELTGPLTGIGNRTEHSTHGLINDRLLNLLSGVLCSPQKRRGLQALKNECAIAVLDFLYSVLHQPESMVPRWLRKHTLIALYRLSKSSLAYPQCYVLRDIVPARGMPVAGGGYSDIYKALYGKRWLCLKVVRVFQKSEAENFLRIFAKEAILWGFLRHPNITPFLGIYFMDESRKRISLVSPWMKEGNLVTFLNRNPSEPRVPFIHDVARGLEYLHDQKIVHGDLKGVNVLVNDVGEACITDFGLSSVLVNSTIAYTGGALSMVHGCSYRWLAPELSMPENGQRTEASDMWAFGSVCYEILTLKLPYHEFEDDFQVFRAVISGCLLTGLRRAGLETEMIDRRICDLMYTCWEQKPEDRPTCRWIVQILDKEGLIRCHPRTRESLQQDSHLYNIVAENNCTLPYGPEIERILSKL